MPHFLKFPFALYVHLTILRCHKILFSLVLIYSSPNCLKYYHLCSNYNSKVRHLHFQPIIPQRSQFFAHEKIFRSFQVLYQFHLTFFYSFQTLNICLNSPKLVLKDGQRIIRFLDIPSLPIKSYRALNKFDGHIAYQR